MIQVIEGYNIYYGLHSWPALLNAIKGSYYLKGSTFGPIPPTLRCIAEFCENEMSCGWEVFIIIFFGLGSLTGSHQTLQIQFHACNLGQTPPRLRVDLLPCVLPVAYFRCTRPPEWCAWINRGR